MAKKTLDELIDECKEVLQQASSVLRQNLQQIQNESGDLRKKQKKLEEWGSNHLEINERLLIDFDNIVPSNLIEQLQDAEHKFSGLKNAFREYRSLIEEEFEALAHQKRDEIDALLE